MDTLDANMKEDRGGVANPAKTPYPLLPPPPYPAWPLSVPRLSVPGNGKHFKLLEQL